MTGIGDALMAPFVWGSNGEKVTAAELDRRRKLADALRSGAGYVPTGPWSLAGSLADEGVAAFKDSQTAKAESAAQQAVADALAKGDYQGVIANDMATPQQSAVAQALWQQKMQDEDPLRKLQIEQAQLNLEQDRNPAPERQPLVNAGDGRLYDPNSDKWITAPGGVPGGDKAPSGFRYKADGSLEPIPGGPADPATSKGGGANFDDISGLRKEVQGLPSYKNLAQATPIYQSMSETAGRDTRASDLNLVYGLGKIMDPTSVVREGEMFMVQGINTLPDKLVNGINSLLTGASTLSPETRKQILQEAYGRMKGYADAFNKDAETYRGLAGRYEINPQDILPTFEAPKPWEPVETYPEGTVAEDANGNQVVMQNGQWVPKQK